MSSSVESLTQSKSIRSREVISSEMQLSMVVKISIKNKNPQTHFSHQLSLSELFFNLLLSSHLGAEINFKSPGKRYFPNVLRVQGW